MMLAINVTAQSVTFTPSTITTINVAGSITYTISTLGVPNIRINSSGFSCTPLRYDWETVSFTPVFTGTNPPRFRHPLTGGLTINPVPSSAPTANNAEYTIFGPGVYTIRLCIDACPGFTQRACGEITIVAQPTANVNPLVSLEDINELTLPIGGSELLDVTVQDVTDQHNFTWSQAGTNPVALSLPSALNPSTNPTNIPRGSSATLSQLNLSGINKPGNYCYTVDALDERGGASTATECFLVKPAASSLAINITPPGIAPDPNVLFTPVNNVPLNAEITGINTFNDRILYTWSQIAGPTTITLPAPAYTANIASIPVASSTFTVPALNLNALAYGTYTLRLRAEDEYYSGTFVEQDITFIVKPPESNLDVTVTPSAVTTIDPYTDFAISGKVTGINVGSDVIRTYWRQDATNPEQLSAAPFNLTFASPKSIPLGTTEETSNGTLVKKIREGRYIFWYVARDSFYNTADSAKVEILVEPGRSTFSVSIDPNQETSITKTGEGWVLVAGQPAVGISFPVKATLTGVSDKTDNVITYWKMTFSPEQQGQPETQNPTLPHIKDSPKPLPLGTTTDNSEVLFNTSSPDNSAPGIYDLTYVVHDKFYDIIDSTAKVRIIIKKPVNIKPSVAFSPNGDGQNDIWKVRDIESFPDVGVRIINERGELIFETTSVANLPDKGWDGKRRDGKFASEGAYYYEFFDNRDQTKVTAGSFVIVR
jgi:gliding motility-associated-like protein